MMGTAIFIARGMSMVYISEALQIGAYAVFIPASAYYVDLIMDDYDKVKGQALVNCAITLAGVFSNLICGRMLDSYGPKEMLLLGVIVTAVGVGITIISTSAQMKEIKGERKCC